MRRINYGIYISNYGIVENPQDYVELAIEAENSGWNGFFLWDHIYTDSETDTLDSFIVLSAIASKTDKI